MTGWHALLACPVCGAGLADDAGGAVTCASGHSFDIARQGYINLLPGGARPGTADSAEMVAARSALLGSGWFDALDEALVAATASAVGGVEGCIVDVGAGTGRHLAAVLDGIGGGRTGLALDISKHAARRAARAHPRIGAVVCDAWGRLPVRDGVAAAVLNVFAPRNADEFARVLAPGGSLVVASPTVAHLAELVGPLGLVTVDPDKDRRLDEKLGRLFRPGESAVVHRTLTFGPEEVRAAVLMGPSARHLSPGDLDRRLGRLPDQVAVTLSVRVGRWLADTR